MIRVTVYLASRENDQNSDRSWVDGCVKCIGLIVCPHFARLFQISVKALGRASREICEEVRSFLPATAQSLGTNESGKVVNVPLFCRARGWRELGARRVRRVKMKSEQFVCADVEQLSRALQKLRALRGSQKLSPADGKKVDGVIKLLETMEWMRIERTPICDLTKKGRNE